MHLAFVDSNPPALRALLLAKQAGHRVSFLQSAQTQYADDARSRAILAQVDHLVDGLVTTDPEVVTDALATCHAEVPIDVALTQHELSAEAVATACQRLGLRGVPTEAVFTARRKDECRRVLDEAGLASARYALATDAEQALSAAAGIGYPVVFKPQSGAASLLAHVVRDEAEAAAACERISTGLDDVPEHWRGQLDRNILVEELLEGRLVSVEIGVRDGEFFPLCLTGRFRWEQDEVVELGSYLPAGLSTPDATVCVEYASRVCTAIGADLGFFHVEMMLTARGPVLVEFNPRIMGGGLPSAYRHATGTDVYTPLLRLLEGNPVDVPPLRDGCTAIRVVIAEQASTLAQEASLRALDEHPEVLEVIGMGAYHTGAGRAVAAGQTVARFVLHCADRQEVVRTNRMLIEKLSHDLGIPLMLGDTPDVR